MSEPFVLGVNYWPRRKAMYWWQNFEASEVQEEFALIRELGLTVVRIFLLWDDFQPTPHAVSKSALAKLIQVADIAQQNQLRLDVTFFTGHMSGPNWAPRWLLGGPRPQREVVSRGLNTRQGYRNPYHDPVALRAEKIQLQIVVSALKEHPALWLWNLGNEPDLFAWPNDAESGRAWVQDMVQTIRAVDAHHPVACGLHGASLHQNNGFRVDQVYAETDLAVMHSYSMYSPVSRQPLDPDFVPFTCALTASLCGKPVLMEEFGGCTAPPGQESFVWEWRSLGKTRKQFMTSEEDLAAYLRASLPRLVEVGAQGALLWCFADYAETLWTKPPCKEARHERFFGLVRPDGSLKPHALVLKEFAASKPTIQPMPAYAKLKVRADPFYLAPETSLPKLYKQYLAGKERSAEE
jgi:endo-1,4-beta-mannosidase